MEKFDIYQVVTDKIIEKMESGNFSWVKGWSGTLDGAFNRVSKKPYSILNQMLLNHTGEYATFKQWGELGGKIKKGAKSEMVVFWSFIDKKEKDENGNEKIISKFPMLKYYRVFHISQVEGVEPLKTEIKKNETILDAEQIVKTYTDREKIKIINNDLNRAYYSPVQDFINMPKLEQFTSSNEYYSTLFHEMTHSTGHCSRLNRGLEKTAGFGSEEYSKEELVAEIGSAYLCEVAKIATEKTINNSVAYLQSWIKALKNDKRLIISASGQAEKAVNFILGK